MIYNYAYANWTEEDNARRSTDELQEKVIGQYLDKYYYSTFTTSISRNNDRETQIHGLDLTITSTTNNVYTIDEKAAVKWANKNLNTFAFEVDSLNKNGELYDGWFMTNTSEALNDYWLLVWVDSAKTSNFKTIEEVQQVTVSLLKKQDIYDWMHKNHINGKDLKNTAKNLRQNFNLDNYYTYTTIHGLKVTIQPKVSEHAINILLPRTTLVNDLATFSAIVRKDRITPIRKKMGV